MTENNLYRLLKSVGVMPHYLGYEYFAEAVFLAMEDSSRLRRIQTQIYLPIARKHGVTVGSVERNIRTIRDIMLRHSGRRLFEELMGCSVWNQSCPYPKELIAVFADYLNRLS